MNLSGRASAVLFRGSFGRLEDGFDVVGENDVKTEQIGKLLSR